MINRRFLTLALGLLLTHLSPFSICAQGCVDLGLSVNWAICNVGANTPEETGTLFAGGQIKEITLDMSIRDYKKMIMIHTQDYSGNPDYDAATAYMGSPWRTPTAREWEELLSRCTWRWCKYPNANGVKVKGYEVTGPNGNSIFLPSRRNPYNGKYATYESYQCSTPVANTNKMNFLVFSSSAQRLIRIKYADHFFPLLPVRGVIDKNK